MADVFTELAVKLRGPNPGTDEAQVTSTAGGALQVEEVGTSYAEDSVHTNADTGTFVLAVRNDTLAALAGTDGDYAPFQVDSDGALYTNVSNTVTISDGGGSITVDGTVSINSNYEYAEDSVHTTADIGAFVLAVRNDAGAALAADGDYIPFTTDSSGALRVTGGGGGNSEYAEDSVHTDGDTGSYVLSVREDTLSASTTASGDYQSFKTDGLGRLWINQRGAFAEDSVHTSGDDGQFVLAVRNDVLAPLAGADGDYAPFQMDADGALYVNVSGRISLDSEYAEDSVHTSADVGQFVLAVRNDTLAALADTDGDYAPLQVDADGALYVTGSFGINSEYAEDTVHTDGDTGSYVLSVREDTLASSTTATGDYQSFKTDSLGRLWINQRGAFPEDSVHTSADDGQFVLAVRNDTLAPLAGTDGDYAPFQVDALGALYVNVANTTDIAVVTNYEYAEDSVHTSADVGAFVLAVRNDTLATLVDADGDYAPLQVDADGSLYVTGSFAINSEYPEDSVHTDGDTGSFVLAVRNDTLATLVSADGDYAPFQVNASGALYTEVSDISIGHVDDSAFGIATDEVVASGFLVDELLTDSVNEGDIGIARMTLDRRQIMVLSDATTDTNRLSINASGEAAIVSNYEYAEDSVHTDADVGAFVLAVRNDTLAALAGTDGDYAPLQVDASGALYVAVDSINLSSEYAEDSVHTSGDIGQFVLAVRNDAEASLAADGDYTPLQTDATGRLKVDAEFTSAFDYPEDSVHTDGDAGAYVLSVREDTLAASTSASGDYQSFKTDGLGRLWINQRGAFAEDSVHTSGDDDQFVLAVRNDTLAPLAGTDGDYAPIQVNALGALYTDVASISIGHVDDSAFTVGTDEVIGSGFLFDDAATDSVDEGDIGIGRMTADRRQLMRIGGNTDANRVNVDDGDMMLVDRIQDTSVEHTVGTVTSVANNADGTITHTVADGDVFYLKQIFASSSGAPMKVVVQYDDGSVTTLGTFFYSDATPYVDITWDQPVPITGVLGGTDVEIVMTNRAGPAQDIYGTIMGRVADLT